MQLSSGNVQSRYQNVEGFGFSQTDKKLSEHFSTLVKQARKDLPKSIYSSYVLTHLQEMKKNPLYPMLKTMPKAVLHHCHIDCNEDQQFYRKYIINDPIIYLSADCKKFNIGTQEQAASENWVSMQEFRKKFNSQDEMVEAVSNLTMFNKQDNTKIASKEYTFWDFFQTKIIDFFTILYSLKHFKLYLKHVFLKYIANGYDRLQFRSMLSGLNEYDDKGNLVKKHPQKKFTEAIDEVYYEVKKDHPQFTIGFIFFGLKMLTAEQNEEIFRNVCELNWDKTVGLDLVQQEDPYGSLEPYDQIVTKVLKDYPKLQYKRVYHAGETKHPDNENIEIAVRAGSVRIGHGINILQRLEFLPECKNVCFQICPISNILTSTRDDTRISTAPVLMSLGQPLTINPDDPGKFGYEDSTVDYFSSLISYNWELKDLKLLGYHSINHAVCSGEEKFKLNKSYNQRWNDWALATLKSLEK